MVDVAFDQADLNQDNKLDAGEFRNFLAQNIAGEAAGDASAAAAYSSSSYESASAETVAAGNAEGTYGASAGLETDLGLASNSYESTSSYSAGDLAAAGYNAGGYDSSISYVTGGAGYGAATGYDASTYGVSGVFGGGDYSSSSSTAVQTYATDAQGLFQDNNPQVIRRGAATGPVTYTQNIRVRFLQPPPVPPPGVSLSSSLSHYPCPSSV